MTPEIKRQAALALYERIAECTDGIDILAAVVSDLEGNSSPVVLGYTVSVSRERVQESLRAGEEPDIVWRREGAHLMTIVKGEAGLDPTNRTEPIYNL